MFQIWWVQSVTNGSTSKPKRVTEQFNSWYCKHRTWSPLCDWTADKQKITTYRNLHRLQSGCLLSLHVKVCFRCSSLHRSENQPTRQMQIRTERIQAVQTKDRETNRRRLGRTKIPLALGCAVKAHSHHSDCGEINSFLHHIQMNFFQGGQHFYIWKKNSLLNLGWWMMNNSSVSFYLYLWIV